MKKISSLFLFLILALAAENANAQAPVPSSAPKPQQTVQPADENDVVRVTTNLIQLDAVVTDKNGRVVPDLRPEDFEIFVNGKPQQITNFSFITVEPQAPEQPSIAAKDASRNAPPIPAARLRPEQVNRTIALIVDDLTMDCRNMPSVRKALKKFIDVHMQLGDLVAIVRSGSGIGALQQFTSNKQQLYAAVERVKYNPAIGKCFGEGGQINFNQERDLTLQTQNNGIDPGEDDMEFRGDIFAVGSLGATAHVVRGMRELPGRKAVMLLSEGFPVKNSRIIEGIRRLVDIANRSGVVIYTMDTRGLVAEGLTAADLSFGMTSRQIAAAIPGGMKGFLAQQDGLIYLAKQAGGFAIYNSNDISGGIRKVLDDQKSYYLIGYQPDASTFDATRSRFNQFTVKVRGSDLTVRYRSGFFGLKDGEVKPAANTPQRQILKALTSPFASGDISLRLTPLFGSNARTGPFVRSLVHISAKDLTFEDKPSGSREAVINIAAYTFGDNGIVVDSVGEIHTLTLTDELYRKALNGGLVYSLSVPIKNGGAYQLRVAVQDGKSNKVGTASQFINIPDIKKDRLALSGIALSSYDPKEVKNRTLDPNLQSTGETSGDNAMTQAALRRFRTGHVLRFAYAIYNARVEKRTTQPQLTAQIKLYRDGKELYGGEATPYETNGQSDLGHLLAEGGLQLGGLGSAEYVLQVTVTDLLAKGKYRTTTNWIDFEIVK